MAQTTWVTDFSKMVRPPCSARKPKLSQQTCLRHIVVLQQVGHMVVKRWQQTICCDPYPKFHLRSSVPCQVLKQRWLQRYIYIESDNNQDVVMWWKSLLLPAPKSCGQVHDAQEVKRSKEKCRISKGYSMSVMIAGNIGSPLALGPKRCAAAG